MKRVVSALAIIALAACQQQPAAPSPPAGKGGPPPPPPYQMRAKAPSGSRLAQGRDGKALFEAHCGYCHLTGGMGTNLLTKQRMALGEPPAMGMLTARPDLSPAYVRQVVRSGKNAMPPQTRVDITDAELASVAAYLGKAR